MSANRAFDSARNGIAPRGVLVRLRLAGGGYCWDAEVSAVTLMMSQCNASHPQ